MRRLPAAAKAWMSGGNGMRGSARLRLAKSRNGSGMQLQDYDEFLPSESTTDRWQGWMEDAGVRVVDHYGNSFQQVRRIALRFSASSSHQPRNRSINQVCCRPTAQDRKSTRLNS